MGDMGPTQILLASLEFLLLAMLAGMFCTWGFVIRGMITGTPILPVDPLVVRSEAPWGSRTVLLVILLYIAVNLGVEHAYALATGRILAAGPPPAAAAPNPEGALAPEGKLGATAEAAVAKNPPAAAVPGDESRPVQARSPLPRTNDRGPLAVETNSARPRDEIFTLTESMTLLGICDVILLILLPLLARLSSGARLRDFGLSWNDWQRQVRVGICAGLCAAPAAYAIQFASVQIWHMREHPVHTMVKDEFSLGVADLAILSAVVIAPIFEEMMFRGILQRWFVRAFRRRAGSGAFRSLSPDALVASGASAPDATLGGSELAHRKADRTEDRQDKRRSGAIPAPREARDPAWPAIILTATIFGAVHAAQWPAPIALFVLGLFIGTVYHRTGSLLAAVCMHALFNAFSTTAMFVSVLYGQAVEAPKATSVWVAPIPTTQIVYSLGHVQSGAGRLW
jgi:membrane protease YdiL (CAAX protease family)